MRFCAPYYKVFGLHIYLNDIVSGLVAPLNVAHLNLLGWCIVRLKFGPLKTSPQTGLSHISISLDNNFH